MRTLTIAVLFLTVASSSWGKGTEFDYNIAGVFKNRTLTLGILADLTHQTPLWGEQEDAEHPSLLRGYWESYAEVFTAGLTNIVEPVLQIFPLPVIGIGVGGRWSHSFLNSLDIKACGNTLKCTDLVQWIYGKLTLQAAYEGAFLRGVWQKGPLRHRHTDIPFYESTTVLTAPAEGSQLETQSLIAGLKTTPVRSFGILHVRNKILADRSQSIMWAGFARLVDVPWTYFVGLGTFESPVLRDAKKEGDPARSFLILLSVSFAGTFRSTIDAGPSK